MTRVRAFASLAVVLLLCAAVGDAAAGRGAQSQQRALAAKRLLQGKQQRMQQRTGVQHSIEAGGAIGLGVGVTFGVGLGMQREGGRKRLVLSVGGGFRGLMAGAWARLGFRRRAVKGAVQVPTKGRRGVQVGYALVTGGELELGKDAQALHATFGLGVMAGTEKRRERRFGLTPWWKGRAIRRLERGFSQVDEALQMLEWAKAAEKAGATAEYLDWYHAEIDAKIASAEGITRKLGI
jgi:hypothetical protein